MKFRIFNVAAMAMMAASILTGCGDKQEDPIPPTPPTPSQDFTVTLTEITATTVYVDVVPSDKKGMYLSYYLTEKEYAEFGSKTGTQQYVTNTIASFKEMYPEMTTAEILEQIAIVGNNGGAFQYLDPATKFYATVVGVNTKGALTTDPNHTEFTTKAESGEAPTIKMELAPGLEDGSQKSKNATATITISANSSYGMGALLTKAQATKMLEAGLTYIDILYVMGAQLSPLAISGMIDGGYKVAFEKLDPSTTYTAIFMFVANGGKYAEAHADVTTGEIGSLPEYKPETITINAMEPVGFGNRLLKAATLR